MIFKIRQFVNKCGFDNRKTDEDRIDRKDVSAFSMRLKYETRWSGIHCKRLYINQVLVCDSELRNQTI